MDATSGDCRLHLDGEMTVATAAALRDEMLAALPAEEAAEVELDLSGVSEIDTAGLQLLLQLKRRCGARLRLVNHSPAVLQILDLSRVRARLGDPVVIPSGEPHRARA
ncbi:MAG: STAS domain-containing protein [Zoogloeaceae bacterium]|nr:STAS domain-containing protein [Zoogloeaceae bacterium]